MWVMSGFPLAFPKRPALFCIAFIIIVPLHSIDSSPIDDLFLPYCIPNRLGQAITLLGGHYVWKLSQALAEEAYWQSY